MSGNENIKSGLSNGADKTFIRLIPDNFRKYLYMKIQLIIPAKACGSIRTDSFDKNQYERTIPPNKIVGFTNWVANTVYFISLNPWVANAEIKRNTLNGMVNANTISTVFNRGGSFRTSVTNHPVPAIIIPPIINCIKYS